MVGVCASMAICAYSWHIQNTFIILYTGIQISTCDLFNFSYPNKVALEQVFLHFATGNSL